MERSHSNGEGCVIVGGAKRSYKAPAYTGIPLCALRRLAARYSLGAERYSPGDVLIGSTVRANWKAGDVVFFSDAFNHVIEHLYRFLEEGNDKDDNLAAAAWGIFALMWAEENGVIRAGGPPGGEGPEAAQAGQTAQEPPGPPEPPESSVSRAIRELLGLT